MGKSREARPNPRGKHNRDSACTQQARGKKLKAEQAAANRANLAALKEKNVHTFKWIPTHPRAIAARTSFRSQHITAVAQPYYRTAAPFGHTPYLAGGQRVRGTAPGDFFYDFKAILKQNLHITRPTAPRWKALTETCCLLINSLTQAKIIYSFQL